MNTEHYFFTLLKPIVIIVVLSDPLASTGNPVVGDVMDGQWVMMPLYNAGSFKDSWQPYGFCLEFGLSGLGSQGTFGFKHRHVLILFAAPSYAVLRSQDEYSCTSLYIYI